MTVAAVSSLITAHLSSAADAGGGVPARMLITKGPPTVAHMWWRPVQPPRCLCALVFVLLLGNSLHIHILQREDPLNVSEAGSCLT